MKNDEYAKMYEAETGFWWFVAKGRLVEELVRRWFPQGGDFLDAGCGTGANLDRAAAVAHLDDDFAAADEIIRVLKPGGRVIVTVPAYQELFGAHDHALGHFRRYSMDQVERLFDELDRIQVGHFFGIHLPMMLPVRVWQRFFGNRTETIRYRWPGLVNRLMLAAAEVELKLLRRRPFPFGTTIFLVAEKLR